MYMHHPKNWTLHVIKEDKKSKPMFLPEFSVLRLTAGVNLVRRNGNRINSSVAVANLQDEGFTVIDPNKHDYLRVYPCMNGNRYEDAFTKFEQVGGTLIRTYDHDGLIEFKRNLMRTGVIAPPHEHFIKLMILDNQRLIDKYAQLTHNPNHEALYKKAVQKDKDLKQAKQALKKNGVDAYV